MIINRDPRFQLIKICFFLIFTVRFLLLLCCTNLAGLIMSDLVPKNRKRLAPPRCPPPFRDVPRTGPYIPMEPPWRWRCTQHARSESITSSGTWTRPARAEREAPAPLRLRPRSSGNGSEHRAQERISLSRAPDWNGGAAASIPPCACRSLALPRANRIGQVGAGARALSRCIAPVARAR